jgi:hypothetical protein
MGEGRELCVLLLGVQVRYEDLGCGTFPIRKWLSTPLPEDGSQIANLEESFEKVSVL